GYTFQQLAAGTYYLRLRDANSCESAIVERTVRTLYGGPTFLNTNQIVLDASCKGNDGKIFIIPMSGKPPFQYSLNDGLTYTYGPAGGYTFTGLRAGTYQLRLKDARGCESKTVVKDVRPNAFGSCLTVWPFQRSAEPKETTVETRSFPNPTNGPFDIQLPNASGNLRAVLLDSKGTVVQQKAMIVSEGNRLHFDLSGKAKGLYLVKVITIKDVQVIKVNVQ
ncbi:MAG TPA: T9SS type A sorting domain-containing protein, partial [Flavisolibacter sp.]|nr:T9SS type A sorting domain-containing protein [Flavisolibacter sp.]